MGGKTYALVVSEAERRDLRLVLMGADDPLGRHTRSVRDRAHLLLARLEGLAPVAEAEGALVDRFSAELEPR